MTSSWEDAQKGEQIYWQARCSSAVGVMYEMAEHSDLAAHLIRILDRSPSAFLDVGVGPMGVGLLWLYPQSSLKIGVDTLPLMTVHTGNVYVDAMVNRIREDIIYILSLGEDLPLSSESFDLVVCNNVLDHAISPSRLLDELCRVTKKNGHLGIGVDTNSVLGYFMRWIDRRMRPRFNPYRLHPHDLIIGQINKILRIHGFHILCHNEASRLGAVIGRRRMQWWVSQKM
jgi:SAM-dependent methyltransferase